MRSQPIAACFQARHNRDLTRLEGRGLTGPHRQSNGLKMYLAFPLLQSPPQLNLAFFFFFMNSYGEASLSLLDPCCLGCFRVCLARCVCTAGQLEISVSSASSRSTANSRKIPSGYSAPSRTNENGTGGFKLAHKLQCCLETGKSRREDAAGAVHRWSARCLSPVCH